MCSLSFKGHNLLPFSNCRSMVGEAPNGDHDVRTSTASNTSPSVVSAIVSVILVLFLLVLAAAFVYIYGRNNPGGMAARFAMRLEANYKRFGGEPAEGGVVELGSSAHSKTNPMADINLNNPDENSNDTSKIDYSQQQDKNLTVNF